MYFMMRKHDFPGTNIVEHHIAVGDVQPIRRPPYRTHFALRDEMQSQIQTLDKGVIRKSHSPWSAPAILAPKKVLMENPSIDFVLILEPLIRCLSSILTHCQILKKPCPTYIVQNNLPSLTSILGSGCYTLLNHIKREPLTAPRLDITNFRGCHLAWLTGLPIFKSLWTQS